MKTVLLFLAFLAFSFSLIHELDVKGDKRKNFFVENFGFEAGGQIHLIIRDFSLSYTANAKANVPIRAGFIVKRSQTDATRYLEDVEGDVCVLDEDIIDPLNGDHLFLIPHVGNISLAPHNIQPGFEGFYNIYFANCEQATVSFKLTLDLHNPMSYLSAGQKPLPRVYAFLSLLYLFTIVFWVFGYVKGATNVYSIHYLMTVFLVIKMFSVLFKSIELHYLKIVGHAAGWAALYYVFATLKGMMLFLIIVLIGSGWSFIKPFLNDKDKKIFLVVIPLQILDNIAMIVIEETTPGMVGWFTWKDIFRLVDIICCGAILIPIIWSIRHLKEASTIDGKAARNLRKLKLFRQFYLMVVSYIYFTRIIIYLLDATLPFRWLWLGDFFNEVAAFIFFTSTGYKFHPGDDNPLLQLEENEKDIEELRAEEEENN